MSRRQNTLHIFMGNQNILFSIDHNRYIRLDSSEVGYPRHLYTKNVKFTPILII